MPRFALYGTYFCLLLAAVGVQPADSRAEPHQIALHERIATAPPAPGDQVGLERTIHLDLRQAPLVDALEEVGRRADLSLVYSRALLPVDRRISLRAERITAGAALERILAGTRLGVRELPGGQVVILPAGNDDRTPALRPTAGKAAAVPLRFVSLALAHRAVPVLQGTLRGQVTDAVTGRALPGAQVSVVGTQLGAQTDSEGRYSITGVPAGSHTVRVTYLGYGETSASVTVASGQTATLDFQLQAQAVALDEMVVVGYGTVRRSDVTGSTSSISTSTLEELPLTSIEQALQGRAAGVQVIKNTGAPGGDFTVRIRGGNSMRGGNDPLYVVDGFPIAPEGDTGGNILNMLDTDDIQSIEILKDASATAIYGARGANGVVMITTKKGRAGSRLEFESYYGVQEVPKIIPMMNARQYAETVNDWARVQGFAELPFPDPANVPFDTNWQEELFRTAPLHSHSLSFSGGSEQTRYLITGTYLDQEGIVLGSDFERGSLRANVDSELNDRLRVSNQFLFAQTLQNEVPAGGAVSNIVEHAFVAPPTVPVYDEEGNYFDYSEYPWWGAYPRNPIADANEITNRNKNFRVLESFSAEYTLLDGLTARALLGADYRNTTTDYYATRRHEAGGAGGRGLAARGETVVYLNESTLNYVREMGTAHHLNATGGFTWQRAENSGLTAEARGFVNDLLENNVLGTGESISPPQTELSDWTLISWLGRVNYTLLDRYLFTVTGRADGSSRFGAGNKWAFFPSAAFAWRLSNEPFLSQADRLSDLKLRLSYGRTGNQEIGLYNSLLRVAPVLFVDGEALSTGFAPANISNPDLRWETTEQYNAGIDLGLWDQRLTFTADIYRKDTTDLLALVNLPSSSGFTSMLRNVGAIRNSGLELSLGAVPVQTASVQWSLDANAAMNRNEVVELAQDNEFLAPNVSLHGPIHLIREGEPLSVFYGFVEDGLDERGNIKYVDQNNDGIISDLDRVILGDPYPDLTYGLSTTLSYGQFDLSATFQGVYGNEIYNSSLGYAGGSLSKGYNQLQDVYQNYWTPENPDPNAPYPRLSTTTTFRPSQRFLEDGSYLRLASLRLGYRVPTGGFRWSGADDLLVYVAGQNLITWTDYSWYDPEINRFGGGDLRLGVDSFSYPQARTVTVGARVGL